ncbi:uncharacterized protein GGS25DRAFT_279978 [Hypoxylon fragiforme]|uniref:uncharacterized protein n=1 Tax=Hypoxylon fragiforme TaxID=63214 RepID=UPI0020C6275A|nr:uncharacterized protein GGS25DRAFT_279978 [Hypoxylon fragiforme]KAI2608508.1 hypothetical protein GGS25DRAFT_279978 [Hypoxylon fragiforme]
MYVFVDPDASQIDQASVLSNHKEFYEPHEPQNVAIKELDAVEYRASRLVNMLQCLSKAIILNSHGIYLVYIWYISGIYLVYIWYISGIYLVYIWYRPGIDQVYIIVRCSSTIPEMGVLDVLESRLMLYHVGETPTHQSKLQINSHTILDA